MFRSPSTLMIILYTLTCLFTIGGLISVFVFFRNQKKYIIIGAPIIIMISLCCIASPILYSNISTRPAKSPLSFANPTPVATKAPQWSSDLLIDREPSYWIPSRATFSFNKLDIKYGTVYDSNIDVSGGSQSNLNTLNDYGRIVSFGHTWIANGCIDGNAVPVNVAYAYAIIMDSTPNAQRYFDYNKQMDKNENSFSSFIETPTDIIGEEYYIARFEHRACFLSDPEILLSFRRNNVIAVVGAKSFNMNEYVLESILEAARLLDQSIITEAKNNPGDPSKLEALFAFYSTRALKPQIQSDSYNAPNDDGGILSCDEGGPCDCGGADRNSNYCMGYFQQLYNEEHPVP